MSRTEKPRLPGGDLGPPEPQSRARPELRFAGIGVSPGIAIGPGYGCREPAAIVAHHRIQASDIEAELARLESGVRQSLKQLGKLRQKLNLLPEEARSEIEPLIAAYIHMLGPTRLMRGIRHRIRETLVAAETAVLEECEDTATLMLSLPSGDADDDHASRERRAEEVREIGRRVVRNLTRTAFRSFADLPDGAIVVSDTLRPADAALLDPERIAGVATDEGAPAGHTAIMLRSLGLPTVLGAAGLSHRIGQGDPMVIDGTTGIVVVNPSPQTLAQAREGQLAFAEGRHRLAGLRRLAAETSDGHRIGLHMNLELLAELPMLTRVGAEGVGLLRTEFIFMNRETPPDETEQTDIYRQVIAAAAGNPVTIRVLDWGGEKDIEALSNAGLVPELHDSNPALGLRGIRLLLRRPTLFEAQLSAILRAAATTAAEVRIMIPMVTCLDEVRQSRAIYDRVLRRLRRDGVTLPKTIPALGVMIETPGAALSADALAAETDFFALGTNDLTMYTLAVDRAEGGVSALFDPLHPAVLRLIQFAVEAAQRFGRPVSVCGEIAGDPDFTPLLLGLGVTQLSMNAVNIPKVKEAIRSLSMADCRALALNIMRQSDPDQVKTTMSRFNRPPSGH
jgi:phosphotransferase system enzyme I (PtsI)